MADRRGGGAEAHARNKQYDYKANSSLVLTAEGRTRAGNEPTGEPTSLAGNLKYKMGDRVVHEKPSGLDERKAKLKKKRDEARQTLDGNEPKRTKRSTVMDVDVAMVYQPSTRETREAYEALLDVVQRQFGDQPADVLRGCADEVILVLKNQNITDPQRHKEVQELMGEVTSEKFANIVAIGKLLTDFTAPGEGDGEEDGEDGLDDDIGVAVEFDDEDEEDNQEVDEVARLSDDDEDLEGLQDTVMDADLKAAGGDADDGEVDVHDGLRATDIDAYWLQRQVTQAVGEGADEYAAQALADDVLRILGENLEDRAAAETELVTLLDFEHFDLVKKLLEAQVKVVWCTRLARAQGDEERGAIEKKMAADKDAAIVLAELRAGRASARDRETAMARSIREEARKLAAEGGGDADAGPVEPALAAEHRTVIDLESLAFTEGGRFMSSRKTQLPEGSYRTTQKGYEEIHVPALKAKPFKKGEELKRISDLPTWCHPAFKGMESLNRVQSAICDCALFSAENMLICAPTGAGKTNCAMLTILHELGLHRTADGKIDTKAFKIVYIAPMKALVAEMVSNFSKRLSAYNISVRELTGDINLSRAEIEATQIIVTTPEKWDIITRKSGDRTYTNLVRLLIIDEVHLLHDGRGPVLESIAARTLRQVEATQEITRIVGLSATLPNHEDVAAFLRVRKGLFHFDNSYRPCPLAQQYVGVTVKKPLQRFQLMNEICYNKVLACAGKDQVMVFVHSRKETAKTARFLKQQALTEDVLSRFVKDDSVTREILATEAENTKNKDLSDVLPYGFGIHHAGMARADRELVEDLFADGHIQVLVSTATLAWGVNLPAHTVIIKGTQIYNPVKGAWDELSPLDVMQMFGRAGRPQYDTFGEGIIITTHQELQFYLSLFNQQLPIESQYVATIADNLNAECVLGTVQDLSEVAQWLGYTYLYVRMLRNPNLYGIPVDAIDADPALVERRMDMAHSAALALDKAGLLRYDARTGNLQPTELGRIASHYYVTHGSITAFNEHLRPTMGDIELLRLFCLSEEFKYLVVREEEKLELAKLVDRVPIPIKESIDEPAAKINVLLQAYISNLKLDGLTLMSDMVYVTQSAGRLLRCLFEICMRRGWSALTEKALALCKMVNRRMWGSQTPLRQFPGLSRDLLVKLEKKDLAWERYYDLAPSELGELVRMPKMGKLLHKLVHQFPKLELQAHVQPITRSVLKVDLHITPDFQWSEHGPPVEGFWVLVDDADSEVLLHSELWTLKRHLARETHVLTFTVPLMEPLPPQYFVRVVSDRWLGGEAQLPISFRHLILVEKYPPPTELLDLQPLPVSALRNPEYEALYADFATFNPIQTQTFQTLFNTDDNALVGAPTGSGKTVCAEFALLRMLNRAKEAEDAGTPEAYPKRCVYIAPMAELAAERYADWRVRFGEKLGIKVVRLTGESAADLKLLNAGEVVIAEPEQWDSLSRRWKNRAAVVAVSLFLVDELHLIGGAKGPALEVIVSRARYIAANTDAKTRIVALATSLANAKDLGEWIGTSAHTLFNFPPAVRPVPLEIEIKGVDIGNFEARMQAMARPAYSAVTRRVGPGKPAIVFVPTRKHARATTLDLLTFAAADGEPRKFCASRAEDMEPFLERIKDKALRHSMGYGVAFMHENMTASDQRIVRALFESGAALVLVATAAMAWGLGLRGQSLVILGTKFYDGTGLSSGDDYPVTTLLQMMGAAGRAGTDVQTHCLLMCHAPRKQYYKKFLFEPFPVESHLDQALHDHFVAEIVTRTIETLQDAVDYLTWTFFYRRLAQNPNYYNMAGMTHRHISDHLSDLVQTVMDDLQQSKVIALEGSEDVPMDCEPLNLGMIAAYYYIGYTSIELFASSLTAKTKLKGLLGILSHASEFDALPMRPGEEDLMRRLLTHAKIGVDDPQWHDPHTKANALLQAHFSRTPLGADLRHDQSAVVLDSARLLQAIVDVIASNGWLRPALAAMEMSQMLTQGLWHDDSELLQIPNFGPELVEAASTQDVKTIFDLMDMNDDDRSNLLAMDDAALAEVAEFCNRYPDIEVSHVLAERVVDEDTGKRGWAEKDPEEVVAGEALGVQVSLERQLEGELTPVGAPRFPTPKAEAWWLLVGDVSKNALLGIKRVTLGMAARTAVDFTAPTEPGEHELALYFMCDGYMGCDQEFELKLKVSPADDAMSE